MENSRDRKSDPTGPVCTRAQDDAENHENSSWGLDAHHRDTEGANESRPVGLDELRDILKHCASRSSDAEEGGPSGSVG